MDTHFVLPVVTDYSLSVEDLLKNSGFDSVALNIDSKHFPTSKTGIEKSDVRIVSFHKNMTPEEAIREIEQNGCRSVDLHTLLSFDEQHRKALPCWFPVVPLCERSPIHLPIHYKILTFGARIQGKEGDSYIELRISEEEHMIGYFNTVFRGKRFICPAFLKFAVQKIEH